MWPILRQPSLTKKGNRTKNLRGWDCNPNRAEALLRLARMTGEKAVTPRNGLPSGSI